EQSTLVEPPVQVAQLAHKRNDRTRLRQPALGEEDPPPQDRHAAPYPAPRSRRPQTRSHRRVRVNGRRGPPATAAVATAPTPPRPHTPRVTACRQTPRLVCGRSGRWIKARRIYPP